MMVSTRLEVGRQGRLAVIPQGEDETQTVQ